MAVKISDYNSTNIPTWCPGCGNFAIHTSIKKALSELNISPSEAFMAFDIGCAGNGADKITLYAFKGLHGRAIPLAVGAYLANRNITVFADIGDGGCFHEGLDHLVHAIRSNYNITILIHNNENFALTTGQATVSTKKEKPMYGLPSGRPERDLNTSEFILNLQPSFYAKTYSGDPLQMSNIIKQAVKHKGCSIIEVMQICPTYNKEFTPEWASQNIKKVTDLEKYDPTSIENARELLLENSHEYTGIIFKDTSIPTFYESLDNRKDSLTELIDEVKQHDIKKLLPYFK
jgi:2-oxoglutarate/2-oxoacid ferredoxin oxidoreductase subunit beta